MADSKRHRQRRLSMAVKGIVCLAAVACGGLTLVLVVGRGSLDDQSQLAFVGLVVSAALALLLAGLAWTGSSAAALSVVGGSLAGVAATISAVLALMAFDYGVTSDLATAMRPLRVATLLVPVSALVGLGSGLLTAVVLKFRAWRASKRAAFEEPMESTAPAIALRGQSRRRTVLCALLTVLFAGLLAPPVYHELIRRHAVLTLRAGGADVAIDRHPATGWRSWLEAINDFTKDEFPIAWDDEVPLYSLESIGSVELQDATDADLALVARLPEITSLSASGSKFTDSGLVHLRRMTALHALSVQGKGITNAGLKNLSGLTALQVLSLEGTSIDDDGLPSLSGLTNVFQLNLNETRVEGSGLRHLASVSVLSQIMLQRTRLTQPGLGELRRIPALRYLTMSGSDFNETAFRELSQLTNVSYLGMSNTNVIDAWLPHLTALGNAKVEIVMYGTDVSDEAADELELALPNARIIATPRTKTN